MASWLIGNNNEYVPPSTSTTPSADAAATPPKTGGETRGVILGNNEEHSVSPKITTPPVEAASTRLNKQGSFACNHLSQVKLLPHNNPRIPRIALRIENPKRDRVLTGCGQGDVDRVSLFGAIGDSVVGVDGGPVAAVDAVLGGSEVA